MRTHEQYIEDIRALVADRADAAGAARIRAAKLSYGAGDPTRRGSTYYEAWTNGSEHDFIEICAISEESNVQLAGTTIHELGHVLARWENGHNKTWKDACKLLGLTAAQAGQQYAPEHFDPDVWTAISALDAPDDGKPTFKAGRSGRTLPPSGTLRVCTMGRGTRGGTSRGPGSGSRMRKWTCPCGVIVRVASDDFRATCEREGCGQAFARV